MRTRTRIAAIAATLALVGVGATPAAAVTEIAADPETIVTAVFAEPWFFELVVTVSSEEYSPPLIDESSGTVDVFIEQLPGTFLSGLVVQPGGRVFVSQPPDLPWLAPGTYGVRAQFTPTRNSGTEAAQVSVPDAITILPIELAAEVEVLTAQGQSAVPTVSLSLRDVTEADSPLVKAPPGIWKVSVADKGSGDIVVTREVAQSTEFEPILVELGDTLRPGTDYVVVAEYAPVPEFAPGVVVSDPTEQTFRTPDGSLGELLGAPVTLPIWALILTIVGVLLGAAGLVFGLRARRSPADATEAEHNAATLEDATLEDESINDGSGDDESIDDESGDATETDESSDESSDDSASAELSNEGQHEH